MPSSKRKRAALDDDDDDDEPSYGMKQILPVANLPDDFDDVPMDGMQYLFMVRRDARLRPGTVRVPNPYEKPEPSQVETQTPYPEKTYQEVLLPSITWREIFEYRFRNFRKNFDQPTVHVGTSADPSRHLMPDKKDRDMWWSFLAGKSDSEWLPSKKVESNQSHRRQQQAFASGMRAWEDEDPAESMNTLSYNIYQETNDEAVEEEEDKVPAYTLPSPVSLEYLEELAQPSDSPTAAPREPTTEIMKLIDERTSLHLLMYFTHWFNLYLKDLSNSNHIPTESHARWIFSLLSRVDDFVSPDDMYLLRNLARSCLGILRHVKSQPKQLLPGKMMTDVSCWIILTIIADVWKQKDLWADAEEMLREY